jgi:hypothetical protein
MRTKKYTLLIAIILNLLSIPTTTSSQKFWLTTNNFPNGPKTAIALVRDTCLFVGYQTGILRSFDQGKQFDTTLSTYSIFSLFSSAKGKVYAGGSGKIYRTDNLGDSWDSIQLNTVYPTTQIIENQQGGLFAITGVLDIKNGFVGDGVYYSDNEGLIWTQRNNGLGIYKSCERIAVDRNGRLYLAQADDYVSGNGGLFISENQGLLWEHIAFSMDGKNTVPDQVNIANTTGLSVSQDDSVYFSFYGTAVNALVRLNARKSIQDIRKNSFWDIFKVSNANYWWLDKSLNNIHFAKNGDRYSSHTNSITQGGTYFSSKNSPWQLITYGLGLDVNGNRNTQYFSETSTGKVLMIQTLDERVYWADTSLVSSASPPEAAIEGISILPNLVKKGGKFVVHVHEESAYTKISVYDISGNLIFSDFGIKQDIELKAPLHAGIYFIVAENKYSKKTIRFVVL